MVGERGRLAELLEFWGEWLTLVGGEPKEGCGLGLWVISGNSEEQEESVLLWS